MIDPNYPDIGLALSTLGSLASLIVAPLAVYLLHEIKGVRKELQERVDDGEKAIYARIGEIDAARTADHRRVLEDFVRREDVDMRIENAVLRTKDMVSELKVGLHKAMAEQDSGGRRRARQ